MRALTLLLSIAVLVIMASYVAETSAPGDALYALKTRVSEPVRAMLSITVESRIMRNEEFGERRLEEAEKLAAENRLDVGTAAVLARDFGQYGQVVRTSIDAMMVQNPVRAAELNVAWAARLTAHDEVTQAMMQESAAWRASLPGVADAIGTQLQAAAPPDLYAIGKKATEQQISSMARRVLDMRQGAESTAREAATKTGASGIDAGSVTEQFVNHANQLLDTARSQYGDASQSVDRAGTDAVYVALATSLSASVEAEAYARAALDLASARLLGAGSASAAGSRSGDDN